MESTLIKDFFWFSCSSLVNFHVSSKKVQVLFKQLVGRGPWCGGLSLSPIWSVFPIHAWVGWVRVGSKYGLIVAASGAFDLTPQEKPPWEFVICALYITTYIYHIYWGLFLGDKCKKSRTLRDFRRLYEPGVNVRLKQTHHYYFILHFRTVPLEWHMWI